VAVTTHHDGVSGTEKQAVADDYSLRLSMAETETRDMMQEVLAKAAGFANAQFCLGPTGLNISFCAFTSNTNLFHVVVFNAQGQTVSQVRPNTAQHPLNAQVSLLGGDSVAERCLEGGGESDSCCSLALVPCRTVRVLSLTRVCIGHPGSRGRRYGCCGGWHATCDSSPGCDNLGEGKEHPPPVPAIPRTCRRCQGGGGSQGPTPAAYCADAPL
jgi:hypothetical protein